MCCTSIRDLSKDWELERKRKEKVQRRWDSSKWSLDHETCAQPLYNNFSPSIKLKPCLILIKRQRITKRIALILKLTYTESSLWQTNWSRKLWRYARLEGVDITMLIIGSLSFLFRYPTEYKRQNDFRKPVEPVRDVLHAQNGHRQEQETWIGNCHWAHLLVLVNFTNRSQSI